MGGWAGDPDEDGLDTRRLQLEVIVRFKVGDVVVLVRPRSRAELPANEIWLPKPAGIEGRILRRALAPISDWRIKWDDGEESCCAEYQLAPKRPPSTELSSWSVIEKVTGWSPAREIA